MTFDPTFRRFAAAPLLALAALCCASASAQDEPEPRSGGGSMLDGWTGSAGIGATSATGASESSNINATLRLARRQERWEHLVFASLFKGRSTIVVEDIDEQGQPVRRIVEGDNSDRIALGYQPKYFFLPRTYGFGLLDWESDEPANIDSSFRQVIGVGHRFYENDSGYLSAEIGVGNKSIDPVSGPDVTGGIGYLGLNYLGFLTDAVSVNGDLRADFGSDNTFVEIGVGLSVALSDRLNAKIDHFSRSNSDLDDGSNPLDSGSSGITTFALVFDIR